MELKKVESIPIEVKNAMLKLNFTESQFISEASTALNIWNDPKNKYLRQATPNSLFNALINLCKIGLTLNPIKKECYLVPRKNGEKIDVFLEPSYIGLIKLLTDEGTVKNIQTNVVYDGCEFESFYDINGINFKHIPYYKTGKDKGNIKGCYCLAFLPNGNKQFEYMDINELNEIKEKSESYKAFKAKKTYSAVWVDYESEMVRKTVLRRIYKYLPRSNGSHYIDEAVKLDESAFSASGEQIQMIENLLYTSSISEEEKEQIEKEFVIMTSSGAKKAIDYLLENQIDPMEFPNPSQTDIKNHLEKIK